MLRAAGLRVAEDSAYVLTPLREAADFTLFRGTRRDSRASVLALAVTGEQPSPHSLRRLEHEFSLASDLDAAWAARPLELTRRHGRALLILEDPGGEPLDQVIARTKGQPDLTRVLDIAIGLAAALGQAHRQGLVHKDIKPANALVDEAGRVWLTGFGIASRLARERLALAPPETIAGTLAYMSPEQTGRMNRSVDARSDLYSLGVTLYEMLTGVLPFVAADPHGVGPLPHRPSAAGAGGSPRGPRAGVRHRHAAAREECGGALPDRRGTGSRSSPVPSAVALARPHRRVPAGRGRRIGPVADPREAVRQGARSRGSARRVRPGGRARCGVELVLVSGYSGVGKSSVVNELHKVLVPPRGLFASGKFDQYKRDVPYATLAQAFQPLVRQILVKSEAELRPLANGAWRGAGRERRG